MSPFFGTNPPPLKPQSNAHDLKKRLDWGEPALTIIDVRDRSDFNASRIQGAISMPMEILLITVAQTLEKQRDIYVYGDSDEMTADAANLLRAAGYQQVAELSGGVMAWKASRFPIEGNEAL
jgi:rhodanese-related sulfurtransferase